MALAMADIEIGPVNRNRRRRLLQLARDVAQQLELDEAAITRRVRASEDLKVIIVDAVEVVARSTWEGKLRALSRLLSAALAGDDATLNAHGRTLQILNALDRQDALVLDRIAGSRDSAPAGATDGHDAQGGTSFERIARKLERLDLVQPDHRASPLGPERSEPGWVPTTSGHDVLALLRLSPQARSDSSSRYAFGH